MISHNGPRAATGGRESFVDGRCYVDHLVTETYVPGESYVMSPFEYHCTPCDGIVVTLMTKLHVSQEKHAHSIIERPHKFDQDFDRFQLVPDELWEFVRDALSQE